MTVLKAGDSLIAGMVFNMQKYSIHDGPGIRTTIFLKGCPLTCWWCHNPESLTSKTEIVFLANKCMGCGDCVQSCPNAAISVFGSVFKRDEVKCSNCESCVEACPTGAMEAIGRYRTVAEVLREIEKDNVFYEESGGGVTFSGGEALSQLEFLDALLTACKVQGIHTALDTSGYAPWEAVARIADKVDLFLYDIKLMDEARHRKYTGVSNTLILENLKKLAACHNKIWVRIPVIPGINDDVENMQNIGIFLASLNLREVYLLPYHNIAIDKYARLGRTYPLPGLKELSNEQMEKVVQTLKAFRLQINWGGG